VCKRAFSHLRASRLRIIKHWQHALQPMCTVVVLIVVVVVVIVVVVDIVGASRSWDKTKLLSSSRVMSSLPCWISFSSLSSSWPCWKLCWRSETCKKHIVVYCSVYCSTQWLKITMILAMRIRRVRCSHRSSHCRHRRASLSSYRVRNLKNR
jgi:hypothetical protein